MHHILSLVGHEGIALVSGAVNQDGRSMSLNALHGPSQQHVIKNTLRSGQLSQHAVDQLSKHWTKTSLDDTVETGAAVAVLGKNDEVAMSLMAGKSVIGHLELVAGLAGLIQALASLHHTVRPSILHLRTLIPRVSMVLQSSAKRRLGRPKNIGPLPLIEDRSLTCISSFAFIGGYQSSSDHRKSTSMLR